MNNFGTAQESVETPPDYRPKWRQRESELIALLEAVQVVASSKEWSSLKESIFGNDIKKLERELLDESLKDEPNPFSLRFIAGQLHRAKLYDLEKLEAKLRMELSGIRKLLYGKEE